jgi:hypothetical protein
MKMGLFDKLKKKNVNDATNATTPTPAAVPASTAPSVTPVFLNQLSRIIGVAYIRQKKFREFIGDGPDWAVDMRGGVISFGDMMFPVSFLGSESDSSNSWLWGWVNVNQYPEFIYKDSEVFYQQCMAQQITDLQGEELPLNGLINGHTIASMAAVANGMQMCYYKAPYGGGAAFLLLKGLPAEVLAPVPAHFAATSVSEAIAAFPLYHRAVVDGVMEAYAQNVQSSAEAVSGTFVDGNVLTFTFDAMSRIAHIKAG